MTRPYDAELAPVQRRHLVRAETLSERDHRGVGRSQRQVRVASTELGYAPTAGVADDHRQRTMPSPSSSSDCLAVLGRDALPAPNHAGGSPPGEPVGSPGVAIVGDGQGEIG